MSDVSQIVIHIGSFEFQLHQSILVWLVICVLMAIVAYIAGKKIENADPSVAPKGIVYWSEELYNLCLYVIKGNLKRQLLIICQCLAQL